MALSPHITSAWGFSLSALIFSAIADAPPFTMVMLVKPASFAFFVHQSARPPAPEFV